MKPTNHYYILMEKKKSIKSINKFWKWLLSTILLLIIITTLIQSFTFHNLMNNFNSNCMIDARIKFKSIQLSNSNTVEHMQFIDSFDNHFYNDMSTTTERNEDEDTSRPIDIYQFGSRKDGVKRPETIKKKKKLVHLDVEDREFFETKMIDEYETHWGSIVRCNYICFVPIIEAIVAAVWIGLLCMWGYISGLNGPFVNKPWAIVFPALLFFLAITISSFAYLALLITNLSSFCSKLSSQFHNTKIPCRLLIDRFALTNPYTHQPSLNYQLTVVSAWITPILWTILTCLLIVRCVLAIDFRIWTANFEPDRISDRNGTGSLYFNEAKILIGPKKQPIAIGRWETAVREPVERDRRYKETAFN